MVKQQTLHSQDEICDTPGTQYATMGNMKKKESILISDPASKPSTPFTGAHKHYPAGRDNIVILKHGALPEESSNSRLSGSIGGPSFQQRAMSIKQGSRNTNI